MIYLILVQILYLQLQNNSLICFSILLFALLLRVEPIPIRVEENYSAFCLHLLTALSALSIRKSV